MLSLTTRRLIARRTVALGATRSLNVHEYISMEVMNAHHIATPACFVAETPEEAENIFTHKLNKRKYILVIVGYWFMSHNYHSNSLKLTQKRN